MVLYRLEKYSFYHLGDEIESAVCHFGARERCKDKPREAPRRGHRHLGPRRHASEESGPEDGVDDGRDPKFLF